MEVQLSGEPLRHAYLTWIKRYKKYAEGNYGCCWSPMTSPQTWLANTEVSYYEIIENIINHPATSDEYVKYLWEQDDKYIRNMQNIIKLQTEGEIASDPKKCFITLTFDQNKATPDKVLKFLYQLRDKTKWINGMTAVIENHKSTGILLHAHLILEFKERITKSKVIEKLWSLKGLREIMGASNYIDYKVYRVIEHEKYVRGDKKEEKMPYVMLDREWREANHIPDLIVKNKN